MMEWTDVHYRTLARGSSPNTLGSSLKCSPMVSSIRRTISCGCPSPRVAGRGCFGASLMLNPKFVAEAMPVIAANTDVPVSVSVGLVLMIMIHIMSSVILFTKLLLSHQLGTSLYILGRHY